MDDLVQFLRDRLDEDERLAKAAADHAAAAIATKARKADRFTPPCDGRRWTNDYDHVLVLDGREGQPRKVQIADCGGGAFHLTPHIARHDPARVLAEVDSKRRILAAHRVVRRRSTGCAGGTIDDCRICDQFPAQYPCPTLRYLSLPYAGHPDYREKWRPTD